MEILNRIQPMGVPEHIRIIGRLRQFQILRIRCLPVFQLRNIIRLTRPRNFIFPQVNTSPNPVFVFD
jgi:hypothetical protein